MQSDVGVAVYHVYHVYYDNGNCHTFPTFIMQKGSLLLYVTPPSEWTFMKLSQSTYQTF